MNNFDLMFERNKDLAAQQSAAGAPMPSRSRSNRGWSSMATTSVQRALPRDWTAH